MTALDRAADAVPPRLRRPSRQASGRRPGRVNLIGEHTDYNGGLCLPIALPHRTFAALRRRDDDRAAARVARRSDGVGRGRARRCRARAPGRAGPPTSPGCPGPCARPGMPWPGSTSRSTRRAVRRGAVVVGGAGVRGRRRGVGPARPRAAGDRRRAAPRSPRLRARRERDRRRPTGRHGPGRVAARRAGHALLLDCRDGGTARPVRPRGARAGAAGDGMSPGCSFAPSSVMTASVISPAGTMTQIRRGAGSAVMSSSVEAITSCRPLRLRSKPVTSIPPLRSRSRMLKPIFPRPISPICTV